jgi:hypothetical protein
LTRRCKLHEVCALEMKTCRQRRITRDFFDSKQSEIMQKFDHNIGLWEKRQFFRRKLSKIAENCVHNIDPRPTVCDHDDEDRLLLCMVTVHITEIVHLEVE